jgi:hypothetical protein
LNIHTAKFNVKRIIPAFGYLRPDQVNRARCREYVAQRREQGVRDSTIRRELAVLSAALHWADKKTPAIVEMPPQPPPKSRHLTREEYRTLREAAKKVPHMHLFVILAYSTAGRAGAILDLTWDRVDFERGQIRLGMGEKRAKGRATVPMTEGVRAALLEARKAALTDHVIEYGGSPVKSIRRAFKAAAARAGLPRDTSPISLDIHQPSTWPKAASQCPKSPNFFRTQRRRSRLPPMPATPQIFSGAPHRLLRTNVVCTCATEHGRAKKLGFPCARMQPRARTSREDAQDFGRAHWHCRGHRFDPGWLHQQ